MNKTEINKYLKVVFHDEKEDKEMLRFGKTKIVQPNEAEKLGLYYGPDGPEQINPEQLDPEADTIGSVADFSL